MSPASPHDIYLLAGGPGSRRRVPDPLLQQVFASTGVDGPSVAYVGAANGDDAGFFAWLSAYFRDSGSGRVTLVPLAGSQRVGARAMGLVEAADLVFISGGDVEEGMRILETTGMLPALRRLFRSGKRFFGLSAGSIMLGRQWVRWRDPEDDSSAEVFPCMALAPVCCDTHEEAEDWPELKTLVSLMPDGAEGFGIPTGGGLRVSPGGEVQALVKPARRVWRRDGQLNAEDLSV